MNNIFILSQLLYFLIIAAYFFVTAPLGASCRQHNYMTGSNTLHVAWDAKTSIANDQICTGCEIVWVFREEYLMTKQPRILVYYK